MFRRILVGVDFNAASMSALRWVAATLPRAEIVVAHVVPAPRTPEYLRAHVPPGHDAMDAAPALYQRLRGLAELAAPDRIEIDILPGEPAAELAAMAEEAGADLICVGKSRRRRASGRFGATTPQRLLARTHSPVLVVPEHSRRMSGPVLVGLPDGPQGRRIFATAANLSGELGLPLHALHVLEPEIQAFARVTTRHPRRLADGVPEPYDLGAAVAEELADVRLCLLAQEWIRQQAGALRVPRVQLTAVARLGDPGEEAIAHATRAASGLMVIGRNQGRDRLTDRSLGSAAGLILWAAPCPVLVLGPAPAPVARKRRRGAGARRGGLRQGGEPLLWVMARPSTNTHSPRQPPDGGGDAA